MRVFLSYGYNDRDKWIPALVKPMIEAFGSDVLTGEAAYGTAISDHVQAQIKRSDAMLAFLTRRDDLGQGHWSTHRWVLDEIAIGIAAKVPLVEIRESGVDQQPGIAGQFQHIMLEEAKPAECLSAVAVALTTLHRRAGLMMQLLPEDFIDEVRPMLNRPGVRCTYTCLEGPKESEPCETKLLPMKGGLFCYTPNVPPSALVRVRVEGGGKAWMSNFESPDSLNIIVRAVT